MEFVGDLVGEPLDWLADVLGPLGEHLVHRQAGHVLASGRVEMLPQGDVRPSAGSVAAVAQRSGGGFSRPPGFHT